MRLFGFYLAAGEVKTRYLRFSLPKELVDEVKHVIKDVFGVSVHETKDKGARKEITFQSNIFSIFSAIFGSERIPAELMMIHPRKQRYMLEGWIECSECSDAAAYRSGDTSYNSAARTTSRTLALQMHQISLRTGEIPLLSMHDGQYFLIWHHDSDDIYIKDGKLHTYVVQKRIKQFKGDVYNIEVEDDASYTTCSFVVHNCIGVHAEQNALIQAGREAAGATLYVNSYPCKICAKLIINAGVKKVVMSGEYTDREGLDFLRKAGIELVFL